VWDFKVLLSVALMWSFSCDLADMSVQERDSVSGMLNVVKIHVNTLETFREDHSSIATSIEEKASEICQQQYKVCFAQYSVQFNVQKMIFACY